MCTTKKSYQKKLHIIKMMTDGCRINTFTVEKKKCYFSFTICELTIWQIPFVLTSGKCKLCINGE